MDTLQAALEYNERGWACIPINPETGVCPFAWGHIADSRTLPTEDELLEWFGEKWPTYNIALITGPVSGLVVVDCDNEEALAVAEKIGLTQTPITVTTKRGMHFYFSFDNSEQAWVKSYVGGNVKNSDEWPKVNGLDLRGSKGIVYAPPSPNKIWTHNYTDDVFDLMPEFDMLAVREAMKSLAPKSNVIDLENFRLEHISLEGITPEGYNTWDATAAEVKKLGRKIDAGDGCHSKLISLLGECWANGMDEQQSYDFAIKWMDAFMANPFDDKKVIDSINDVKELHQRNHPDEPRLKEDIEERPRNARPRVITTADIQRLEDELGSVEYFVEPFIPTTGTIFQIHGYSGHGKSTFARQMLYACAAGNDRFGPFQFYRRPRVLYCDFENSRSNVVKFLTQAKHSYGDASDNFMLWCPFDNEEMMNLQSDKGLGTFKYLVNSHRPDIVIIDTVRSAFPAMAENSADDWSHINQLCLSLRNNGISVGLLHHSNKPSEGSASGREAGSTNQLTVLETQLKITQVFQDQDTANVRAGLWDGDIAGTPMAKFAAPWSLRHGERLDMMFEVRYGKVREMTDVHQPFHHIGIVSNHSAKTIRPLSAKTPKQLAIKYAQEWEDKDGVVRTALSDQEIAAKIEQPIHIVHEWTEPVRLSCQASRLAQSQVQ